jgi:tRNA (cytidine(34)-2'-O)-methyltransferase
LLHIALYQPEIPPNTGNIIRLAANTGAQLHLVGPLGFHLDEARLRRAGLDYAEWAKVQQHRSWTAFQAWQQSRRLWLFTTRATRHYHQARYSDEDVLLFGPESRGLPLELLGSFANESWLKIPMQAGSRSLNLANSVSIGLFEAWRQLGFAGAGDV